MKTEWSTALRSGKYEQGSDELCTVTENDSFEFCCLGVGGLIIDKMSTSELRGKICLPVSEDPKTLASKLSDEIQIALSMANDGGNRIEILIAFRTAGYKSTPRLYKQNNKATFKTIADWIDKNL